MILILFQVNSKWVVGDYEGARRSSNKAQIWSITAIFTGTVLLVLDVVIGVILGTILAANSDDTDCTRHNGRSYC